MRLERDLTCVELVELVTEYLEGALATDAAERFEEHLTLCPACVAHFEQMRTTIEVTGSLRGDDLDPGAHRRAVGRFPGLAPENRIRALKALRAGAVAPFSGFRWPTPGDGPSQWVAVSPSPCASGVHAGLRGQLPCEAAPPLVDCNSHASVGDRPMWWLDRIRVRCQLSPVLLPDIRRTAPSASRADASSGRASRIDCTTATGLSQERFPARARRAPTA